MGYRQQLSFLYRLILPLLTSILFSLSAFAQPVGVTSTVAKKVRYTTTLPATCVAGEIYADSDATSGQRVYLCETANTWVLQGAELWTFNAGLENPVAADDDIIQIEPAGAFTITEVACSTATGTATINFNENVNTTPNTAGTAILSADIVCDTNRQSSCASGCDVNTISNAGITAGNLISMVVTSVASTPTKLRMHIKGTYDD